MMVVRQPYIFTENIPTILHRSYNGVKPDILPVKPYHRAIKYLKYINLIILYHTESRVLILISMDMNNSQV
jgi:hypothetical protein